MSAEPAESSRFILSHKTAVACNIGGENGRKPAFYSLPAHPLAGPEGLLLREYDGNLIQREHRFSQRLGRQMRTSQAHPAEPLLLADGNDAIGAKPVVP